MNLNPTSPELVVFQPNRTSAISQVIAPMHIKTTYRFGTASQIEFKVQKYLYDEIAGEWYKNPSYDDLTSDNLIYSSELSPIYKFKGCRLLSSRDYGASTTQTRSRNPNDTGLFFLADMRGCTLQDEYAVFNLGGDYGYNWRYGAYIDDNGAFNYAPDDNVYSYNAALEEFLPVEVGDIISLGCRVPYYGSFQQDQAELYQYRVHYYSSNDATTQENCSEWFLYNPVGRICISDGVFGYDDFMGMGNLRTRKYLKKGYVRIELKCLSNNIVYPLRWYAIVVNGERRCTKVNVRQQNNTDKYYDVSCGVPWWVIKDVDVDLDGYNSTKTITAYSYDYTIANKTFSIDECTLPLFIPDEIPLAVQNSSMFVIDSVITDSSSVPPTVYNYYGAQRMERGLINRILDICPTWSIGYVTPKLLTRYRTIPDCDEVNIYSFLMNTVQELYKCFIIFNTEDMTINLIDKDDVVSINSNAIIAWRNALKSLTITNSDTNYVTALRVHAGDDDYGLGLVNPNGTNVIYNFDHIANELDYVVDSRHKDSDGNPYTLKQRWKLYKETLARIEGGIIKCNNFTINETRNKVINGRIKLTEIETRLSEALTNYLKIADSINVFLDYEANASYKRIPDVPIRDFTGDWAPVVPGYYNYSSVTLYKRLVEASRLYHATLSEFNNAKHEVEGAVNDLAEFSKMLSISPGVLQPILDRTTPSDGDIDGGYFPVFTPLEAKEMCKYIIEGTWTHDNIVFKNDYDADDIKTTLKDVYNTAKSELDNLYSKPTYDFSATIASVLMSDETKGMFENLALGNSLYIVDDSPKKLFDYIKPVLLSISIDYDDLSNTSFELSTDYKRKPLELRFTELFGFVSQVNPSNASFTYDD